MAPSGVPDLSIVTDRLVSIIRTAINAAALGFTVEVSGAMPESVRNLPNCQLTMYMYHIGVDSSARNTPLTGPQIVRQRPFGLILYYLLTAFSKNDYVQEQQAMTIAMRAIHDNPFVRIAGVTEELSATMETEDIDKLGVLWQAVASPFRLSACYRVGIAFVTKPDPTPAPAPTPAQIGLVVDASALPFSEAGHVSGALARVQFRNPDGTAAEIVSNNLAVPGANLTVLGSGLNVAGATDQVFLADAGGANEQDISSWRTAGPAHNSSSRMTLAVPANAPAPGLYQLRAGGGAARTNLIALSMAPGIVNVAAPPVFAGGGPYTIQGSGFAAGATQVITGASMLNEAAGAPNAGEFQVQNPASIVFRPPAGLAAGMHAVRLRVNGIEAAPAWWVSV